MVVPVESRMLSKRPCCYADPVRQARFAKLALDEHVALHAPRAVERGDTSRLDTMGVAGA